MRVLGAQQMETLVFHWAATVPRINNSATRRADLLDQANRGVCGADIPDMVRVKEEKRLVPITIIVRDNISS